MGIIRISLKDFYRVDAGFHRDLFLSDKIYDYGAFIKDVNLGICRDFISEGFCEDIVAIGSSTYGDIREWSDLDFLGVKRGKKNSRYYFKVKVNDVIMPAEATIDNGEDKTYLRFRFGDKPATPSGFIVSNPKCWAFIFPGVFEGKTMMYQIAQIDAFEMLGAILCVFLNENKGGQYYVTPEQLANRIKQELIGTIRRPLFENHRWERGLRKNCEKLLAETLDRSPFWATKCGDGRYLIRAKEGLVPRASLYTRWANTKKFFDPSYFLYLADKKRYRKLPRFVNTKMELAK